MKSRSLLINYSGYPTSPNAFMPDNGLAALAGSLLKNGHRTTILDFNTLDVMKLLPLEFGERLMELKDNDPASSELHEIAETVSRLQDEDIEEKAREIAETAAAKGADFLAMKLWTGKSFKNGVKLARAVKKRLPGVPIFAGGPHVDYFRERIYRVTDVFDALAYGEGEHTIVELAEYAVGERDLADVGNLVLRKDGKVFETPERKLQDLNDSFPIYDTDIYPALKGDKKLKLFISEFSRGCPFKCNFCGHSNKSGARWRSKTAERITEEFRHVIDAHGSRVFRNGDSNTPGALITEVAETILSQGLDVEYALISHVNNLDTESFDTLRRSGCFSVFFGVESGSQHIVDRYINKGLKLDRVKRVIRGARQSGLFVVASFVYPGPGDTRETKNETRDFILKSDIDAVNVCTPIITPRSTWGDHPGEYGIELGPEYFDELMFFTPDLFFPPTMWDPLDYRIGGRDFIQIATESDELASSLEKEGKLTQVMDDAALMARHSGMSFRDFRDNVRRYLAVGDRERMAGVVKRINEGVRSMRAPAPG